jgi:putative inorganic carbon (HCO3(-)) transporter
MRLLVASLLILPPFLIGLNRPLAWSLAAALLLAACAWRPLAFIPAGLHGPHRASLALPLLLAALALFALPLMQLAGGTCSTVPAQAPCVVDGELAWLGMTFALMALLWFLLLAGAQRPSTNRVLALLTVAGTLQACYALATHYTGMTPLFLDGLMRHEQVPTGGFPNRNHLAAFLYLAIFAGIALILRLSPDTGSGRAARWRLLLDSRLLWRLAVVLMVITLIATRSRAGNAVFLIGLLAGVAWLLLVERRRRAAAARPLRLRFLLLLVASVVLVDALLVGSLVGIEKVQQRIADTSLQGEQRDDVIDALLARPELLATTLGHGSASFFAVFEAVKPASLPLLYDEAHNDYLQLLVERGWLGALLLGTALLLALRHALHAGRGERGAEVRFALVAATVALLLHAGVEFVSRIPALWLAWLALLTLACADDVARHRHDAAATSSRNRH